jgi:NAD(P)-dependent dehydrogenase (short-subunit alcohol dehydrogenase family)
MNCLCQAAPTGPALQACKTDDRGVKPVLDGTVALVTGASSGIGAATAAALAGQGAEMVLAARHADRPEAGCRHLKDSPVEFTDTSGHRGQPTAHSRCVRPSARAQCGALPPILAWGRAYLQNELSTTPEPPESSHGPSSSRTIATTLC